MNFQRTNRNCIHKNPIVLQTLMIHTGDAIEQVQILLLQLDRNLLITNNLYINTI